MERLVRTVFVASSLLALTASALAPVFVGCISPNDLPSDVRLIPIINVESQCAQACAGSLYSYFGGGSVCRCSNLPPTVNLVPVVPNTGSGCTAASIRVQKLNTEYTFGLCGLQITYYDSGPEEAVSSALECMQFCAPVVMPGSSPAIQAMWTPSGKPGSGSPAPWCRCSKFHAFNHVSCNAASTYVYSVTRLPGVSPIVRRAQKEAERRARERSMGLCPSPFSACLVGPGPDNDGYECVDTRRELESCGGCIHGSLSPAGNTVKSKRGKDCTQLPGLLQWNAQCVDGQCRATACQAEWTLVGAECLP